MKSRTSKSTTSDLILLDECCAWKATHLHRRTKVALVAACKKRQDWEHFLRAVSWCRVHYSNLCFNKICLSWCNSKHEKEGGCVAYISSQSACMDLLRCQGQNLCISLSTIWRVKLFGTLPQFPLFYDLLLNHPLCSLIFKAISLKLPWHDLVGGIWSLVKPQFSHLTSWYVSELSSVRFFSSEMIHF